MDILEMTFEEFENGKGPINRNQNTGKMEPFGNFLVLEDDGSWSAIDNTNGLARVENFNERKEAISWLERRNA